MLYNFDFTNNRIYLKYNFANSCTTCSALASKFDVFIIEAVNSACPFTPLLPCNIIQNPSFENFYAPCGSLGITTIYNSPPICNWGVPSACAAYPFVGTPDYFNTCGTPGAFGSFTSTANTGSGHMGIWTYGNASSGGDYREYINQTLSTNLITGNTYQFSLYTKAAVGLYSSDLSAFFSTSFPCQPGVNPINTSTLIGQQIVVTTTPMANSAWQKYVVTFTASSNYNQLTIGNFNSNIATSTATTGLPVSPLLYSYYAYYYIDDVSITSSSISINNPAPICRSQTLQVNPSVCELDAVVYSYSWTPSTGLSNPFTLNPIITTGGGTISYTVTQFATTSFGPITNTAVVTVSVVPTTTISISASPAILCANLGQTSATLTASSASALNYTWLPSSATGNTIVVNPTATTIYTALGTALGCNATGTLAVVVQSACCTQPIPAFVGVAFPTTTLSGLTYLSPLVFNNDVTIPTGVSVTLANTEYLFAPGVKIIVSPGASLNLRGSHLYACGTSMWQGIVVQNNGAVNTNISGNGNYPLVEDAVEAINVTSNSTSSINPILNIVNTTFNKNYIGIKINDYVTASTAYPFIINNCVFTSRTLTFTPLSWPNSAANSTGLRANTPPFNSLATPYLLQSFAVTNVKSPFATIQSSIGVWVNNSGITISPTSTAPTYYGIKVGSESALGDFNLFDSQMFGIYAINSNVKSANNVFQNTKRQTFGGSKTITRGGYGIYGINNGGYAANGTNNISTVSSVSPTTLINKFYNCHYGIGAYNIFELNAQYANFRSTQVSGAPVNALSIGQYAIHCTGNMFKNYQVKNNSIFNINTGVYFNMFANTLNVAGLGSTYGQYLGRVAVQNNFIAAFTFTALPIGTSYINFAVWAGSSLSNSNFTYLEPGATVLIGNNTINRAYRGIYGSGFTLPGFAIGSANNNISLVPDVNPLNTQYGVNYNTNTAGSVNTNTIVGTNALFSNIFAYGVYYSMNSNNSVQCNSVSTIYSSFRFNSMNNGTFWRNNALQLNQRGLYLANNGIISQQGTTANACDNRWLGTWGAGNFYTYTDVSSTATNSPLFVRGSAPYYPFVNVTAGLAIQKYTLGSSLTYAGGPFVSCFPTGGGGGGGCSTCREATLNDITTGAIGYNVNPVETDEINKNLAFTNVVNEPTLAIASPTLNSFYTANMPLTRGFYQNIETNLNQGNLPLVATLLAAFTPSTNIENNYKTYYKLLNAYQNTGSLTTLQNLQLLILAYQCPFTDGAVVYQARNLYSLVNFVVNDYNDTYCARLGFSFRTANDSTQTASTPQEEELLAQLVSNENVTKQKFKPLTDYKLYPNPAQEEVYINSLLNTNELVTITISDANGKVLLEKEITITNHLGKLQLNLINGI